MSKEICLWTLHGKCVYVLELTLAITLNGGSRKISQLGYEQTLAMKSPSTSFHVDSCLEIMYTAQSPLLIQLDCVTLNGTYTERPLFTSRQPLGLTLQKLRLALPATVNQYRFCALEFRMSTMTTGVLAAISSIHVFDGQCSLAAGNAAVLVDDFNSLWDTKYSTVHSKRLNGHLRIVLPAHSVISYILIVFSSYVNYFFAASCVYTHAQVLRLVRFVIISFVVAFVLLIFEDGHSILPVTLTQHI